MATEAVWRGTVHMRAIVVLSAFYLWQSCPHQGDGMIAKRARVTCLLLSGIAAFVGLISATYGSARSQVSSASTPAPTQVSVLSKTATAAQQRIDQLIAHDSEWLAGEAEQMLDEEGDSQVAILLGIRAYQASKQPAVERAFRRILSRNYLSFDFASPYPGIGQVSPLGFAPDGHSLIVANSKAVYFLDLTTGMFTRTFGKDNGGSGGRNDRMIFSANGQYMALGDEILDLSTMSTRVRLKSRHRELMLWEFSPDSRYLVTSSDDHVGQLWDVATGQLIRTFSDGKATPYQMTFSPDGQLLYSLAEPGGGCGGSGSETGECTIQLWDVASGNLLRHIPDGVRTGCTGRVDMFSLSADGTKLAMSGRVWGCSTNIEVYDAHTGSWQHTLSAAEDFSIDVLAFLPDGRHILSSGYDGKVRLWDVATGRIVLVLHSRDFYRWTWNLSVSADGQFVITDGRLWQLPPYFSQITQSNEPITNVSYSLDGHYLLVTRQTCLLCGDFIIEVYDTATGSRIFHAYRNDAPSAFAFTPDSKHLAFSNGPALQSLDLVSGDESLLIPPLPSNVPIDRIAFSPDGNRLLMKAGDELLLAALASKTIVRRIPQAPGSRITALAFSSDGEYILTGTEAGIAQIWDVHDGNLLVSFVGKGALRSAQWSPDAHYVVTSSGSSAFLWAVPDLSARQASTPAASSSAPIYGAIQEPQRVFTVSGDATDATFSVDGRYVALASSGELVYLWDIQSGELIRAFTDPATKFDRREISMNWRVAFSPDGNYIALGDLRGTVMQIPYPTGILPRIQEISQDHLLDYACSLVFRDLTPEERRRFFITDVGETCARRTPHLSTR